MIVTLGLHSVLFNYSRVASDLLGRRVLCIRDTDLRLVCMVLERVRSSAAWICIFIGFVLEISFSICFQSFTEGKK